MLNDTLRILKQIPEDKAKEIIVKLIDKILPKAKLLSYEKFNSIFSNAPDQIKEKMALKILADLQNQNEKALRLNNQIDSLKFSIYTNLFSCYVSNFLPSFNIAAIMANLALPFVWAQEKIKCNNYNNELMARLQILSLKDEFLYKFKKITDGISELNQSSNFLFYLAGNNLALTGITIFNTIKIHQYVSYSKSAAEYLDNSTYTSFLNSAAVMASFYLTYAIYSNNDYKLDKLVQEFKDPIQGNLVDNFDQYLEALTKIYCFTNIKPQAMEIHLFDEIIKAGFEIETQPSLHLKKPTEKKLEKNNGITDL